MNLEIPDHDATMRLLGQMRQTPWATFSPILNDPARLRAWVEDQAEQGDPETTTLELGTLGLEARGILTPEEREKLKVAFREIWGPETLRDIEKGPIQRSTKWCGPAVALPGEHKDLKISSGVDLPIRPAPFRKPSSAPHS